MSGRSKAIKRQSISESISLSPAGRFHHKLSTVPMAEKKRKPWIPRRMIFDEGKRAESEVKGSIRRQIRVSLDRVKERKKLVLTVLQIFLEHSPLIPVLLLPLIQCMVALPGSGIKTPAAAYRSHVPALVHVRRKL